MRPPDDAEDARRQARLEGEIDFPLDPPEAVFRPELGQDVEALARILPEGVLFWADIRCGDKRQVVLEVRRDGVLWMNPATTLAQRQGALQLLGAEYMALHLELGRGTTVVKLGGVLHISVAGLRFDAQATGQEKRAALRELGRDFVRMHRLAREVDGPRGMAEDVDDE